MRDRHHSLDKDSPIPLYYQLYLRLQSDMQAGIVRPGDLLGTEKDIQERYSVSRATVRKALDELERNGRLVRITGRGTFVAEPPLRMQGPHLLSFTEEMYERGLNPGSRLLAFEREPGPPEATDALRLDRGGDLLHVYRLRTGDETPVLLVHHYLPPTVRLEPEDLEGSLYAVLERKLGIRLQEAYHTVRAGLPSVNEADLLGIDVGEPVVRFERTTMSTDERPVVYEQGTARSDMYEYSVHLYRQ